MRAHAAGPLPFTFPDASSRLNSPLYAIGFVTAQITRPHRPQRTLHYDQKILVILSKDREATGGLWRLMIKLTANGHLLGGGYRTGTLGRQCGLCCRSVGSLKSARLQLPRSKAEVPWGGPLWELTVMVVCSESTRRKVHSELSVRQHHRAT